MTIKNGKSHRFSIVFDSINNYSADSTTHLVGTFGDDESHFWSPIEMISVPIDDLKAKNAISQDAYAMFSVELDNLEHGRKYIYKYKIGEQWVTDNHQPSERTIEGFLNNIYIHEPKNDGITDSPPDLVSISKDQNPTPDTAGICNKKDEIKEESSNQNPLISDSPSSELIASSNIGEIPVFQESPIATEETRSHSDPRDHIETSKKELLSSTVPDDLSIGISRIHDSNSNEIAELPNDIPQDSEPLKAEIEEPLNKHNVSTDVVNGLSVLDINQNNTSSLITSLNTSESIKHNYENIQNEDSSLSTSPNPIVHEVIDEPQASISDSLTEIVPQNTDLKISGDKPTQEIIATIKESSLDMGSESNLSSSNLYPAAETTCQFLPTSTIDFTTKASDSLTSLIQSENDDVDKNILINQTPTTSDLLIESGSDDPASNIANSTLQGSQVGNTIKSPHHHDVLKPTDPVETVISITQIAPDTLAQDEASLLNKNVDSINKDETLQSATNSIQFPDVSVSDSGIDSQKAPIESLDHSDLNHDLLSNKVISPDETLISSRNVGISEKTSAENPNEFNSKNPSPAFDVKSTPTSVTSKADPVLFEEKKSSPVKANSNNHNSESSSGDLHTTSLTSTLSNITQTQTLTTSSFPRKNSQSNSKNLENRRLSYIGNEGYLSMVGGNMLDFGNKNPPSCVPVIETTNVFATSKFNKTGSPVVNATKIDPNGLKFTHDSGESEISSHLANSNLDKRDIQALADLNKILSSSKTLNPQAAADDESKGTILSSNLEESEIATPGAIAPRSDSLKVRENLMEEIDENNSSLAESPKTKTDSLGASHKRSTLFSSFKKNISSNRVSLVSSLDSSPGVSKVNSLNSPRNSQSSPNPPKGNIEEPTRKSPKKKKGFFSALRGLF
ncbi:hypothetical protein AYI68_g8308 [Smittium mucronatum]|uniref:Uncharacterized protein n=1 Tax=Smittium mucronatum TaxID=133383 RepID=A0A1R0GL92_9FUNG|nr:hypothetical protein AYI68_g8384 [Smittium mucronatum]OLY77656.1 hypothetical protein AYI68_g8308 [Smittium mucronatum]